MRVFVLGNSSKPGVDEAVNNVLPLLRERCEVVLCDLDQQCDLRGRQADLALVFGGDGAILRAARQMGYSQLPVLGVNLGKLGFLADVRPNELAPLLPELLSGKFHTTTHLMYECQVESPEGSSTFLGLNEIVVVAGPPYRLIEVELHIGGELVANFSGDGLIISTPVGSTAHNLSAGGPILQQEIPAFVITLICPHLLTNRSLVDRADKVYTLRVPRVNSGTTLIIDGQEQIALTPEHWIILRRAPVEFKLIKLAGHSYYQTLRDKIYWANPPRYRG
jgi:NAD+ kinase